MRRRNFFKKERNSEYDYLVTYEQPFSYVAESFQKALVNLEYINIDNQFKVIQFTSTLAGAGKTTFISNISHLIGKKGKKVVVVDLDLRKPKVNRIFRAPNEKGVTDYLTGKIDYKTLVNYSEKLNVHYIVAGEKTTAVVNVLEAQKLKDLITKLREEFDYVILDSPPIIAVSDGLYISRLADGVVFVVAQKETKRTVVDEAINTLRRNNVNIIGTVFTQVSVKNSDLLAYTYGYGYGYTSSLMDEQSKE